MQHGLGIEHEFAIEFGEAATPAQAEFVASLLTEGAEADRVRGALVVLDLESLDRSPAEDDIREVPVRLASAATKCLRAAPEGARVYVVRPGHSGHVEVDVADLADDTAGESNRTRTLAEQTRRARRVARKNQDVLRDLARYETLTVMRVRYRSLVVCPARPRPRARGSADVMDVVWTLVDAVVCVDGPPFVEIDYATVGEEDAPILVEVKSHAFKNRTPEQVVREVRRRERDALKTVVARLGPEFDRLRAELGEPRVCYRPRAEAVVIVAAAAAGRDEIRARLGGAAYLGSYHLWITPRHRWVADVDVLVREILPRYIEDCRALAHIAQWAEPWLLGGAEADPRGSFRVRHHVTGLGTTDLTTLRADTSSVVPGLSCAALTSRVRWRPEESAGGGYGVVTLDVWTDSEARDDIIRNDIRTNQMCAMLRVPLRAGITVSDKTGIRDDRGPVSLSDAVDRARWRAWRKNHHTLQGLEVRVFDNAGPDRMLASARFVYDAMIRICAAETGALRLFAESLEAKRRAARDPTWTALCDVVRHGAESRHWARRDALGARLAKKIDALWAPA